MKQKPINTFAVYSGLGIQMAVTIGACAWLGDFLDEKYAINPPWFTIIFSLFGVSASIYIVLKGIINQTK